MKKFLLIVLAAIIAASCTQTLPARFTRLAEKVEAKGANYSEAQWKKSNEQFQKLVQEYIDNYDSFNKEQKKEINKAIAKYSGASIKYGIGNSAEVVEAIIGEIPGVVNSLLEEAGGWLQKLGL